VRTMVRGDELLAYINALERRAGHVHDRPG
jgi:hypothetical protein